MHYNGATQLADIVTSENRFGTVKCCWEIIYYEYVLNDLEMGRIMLSRTFVDNTRQYLKKVSTYMP